MRAAFVATLLLFVLAMLLGPRGPDLSAILPSFSLGSAPPLDTPTMEELMEDAVDIRIGGGQEGIDPELTQPVAKMIMSPVTIWLLTVTPESLRRSTDSGIAQLRSSDARIRNALIIFAVGLVLLMLVGARSYLSGECHLVAKLGYDASRWFILIGAGGSLLMWSLMGYDSFHHHAGLLALGPLAVLIGSAIALRLYDPNSPVYDRTVLTTIWLGVAVVLVRVT